MTIPFPLKIYPLLGIMFLSCLVPTAGFLGEGGLLLILMAGIGATGLGLGLLFWFAGSGGGLRIRLSPMLRTYLLFSLLVSIFPLVTSLIYKNQPTEILGDLFNYSIYFIVFWLVGQSVSTTPDLGRRLFEVMVKFIKIKMLIIATFGTLIQVPLITEMIRYEDGRLSREPLVIIVVLYALFNLLRPKSFYSVLVNLGWFTLGMWIVVASYGRSILAGALLGAWLMMVYFLWSKKFIRVFIALAALSFAVGIFAAVFTDVTFKMVDRILFLAHQMDIREAQSYELDRLRRLSEIYAVWDEKKHNVFVLLFGKGFGSTYWGATGATYADIGLTYGERHFIHNMYVSMFFRLGLVPCLLLLALAGVFFYRLGRFFLMASKNSVPEEILKPALVIASALSGLFLASMGSVFLLMYPNQLFFGSGVVVLCETMNHFHITSRSVTMSSSATGVSWVIKSASGRKRLSPAEQRKAPSSFRNRRRR